MAGKTVVLVDDHPPLRAGIAAILQRNKDYSVVGEAGTVEEGIHAIRRLAPDFGVIDMTLPDGSGSSLIERLVKEGCPTLFVVLSMHARHRVMEHAFQSGARAYLLKESSVEYLEVAMATVAEGGVFIDPKLQLDSPPEGDGPLRRISDGGWQVDLTVREYEVFRMLALGQNSKEIGVALGISPKTADNHRASIQKKLNVSSVAQLVRIAIRTGVIDP